MPPRKSEAIVVERLTKKYGDKEVLKSIDLRVREGEFFALMGPNGSGKTTLTSIMASVRSPTSGKVEIYGRTPEEARGYVAYVPQENFSSQLLTGRENLSYFASLLGYRGEKAKSLVQDILAKIGLAEAADVRVAKYSGGMRKRLEVATMLFPSIRVFILDEPTTGMDPSARKRFLGLLTDFKKEGITVLLTTHIGSDAEAASRVGLMDRGSIIAEGTPENLKVQSGLGNVVDLETTIKSEKVARALSEFSEGGKLLETDLGYRVYSKEADKAIPEIVRKLDRIGCKVTDVESDRPTLEDVFFKLTQKALAESDSL